MKRVAGEPVCPNHSGQISSIYAMMIWERGLAHVGPTNGHGESRDRQSDDALVTLIGSSTWVWKACEMQIGEPLVNPGTRVYDFEI